MCAVVDGAEWQQKFIDLHRPDAVRILDWGHGAEHLARAGQAAFGAGTAAASEWLGVQLHQLKHGDSQQVLSKLRELREEVETASEGDGETLKTVRGTLEYLEKRQDQLRYAEFQAMGYPIGSGAVESANKLVVEVRLKGSGMHWAREHVNPMVALRTVVCSDRWEEVWPQISRRWREQTQKRTASRRAEASSKEDVLESSALTQVNIQPLGRPTPITSTKVENQLPRQPNTRASGPPRPVANHPWRRMPIGRARSPRTASRCPAKS